MLKDIYDSPMIFPFDFPLKSPNCTRFPYDFLLGTCCFHGSMKPRGKMGWKLRAGDQPNHEETIAATALLIQGLAMKYGFEPLKIWGLLLINC
jgi:hypothetical protein